MNIARLDYDSMQGINYLDFIRSLESQSLIVPSLDRDLTDEGRQVVDTAFQKTLDIGEIVRTIKCFRQLNPDVSEMDDFVSHAADLAYVLSSDSIRQAVDIAECRRLMPRGGTYMLAGIQILREATTQRLIEVNPAGAPRDGCYVKYLI